MSPLGVVCIFTLGLTPSAVFYYIAYNVYGFETVKGQTVSIFAHMFLSFVIFSTLTLLYFKVKTIKQTDVTPTTIGYHLLHNTILCLTISTSLTLTMISILWHKNIDIYSKWNFYIGIVLLITLLEYLMFTRFTDDVFLKKKRSRVNESIHSDLVVAGPEYI
jgi:magnesium-transporting ATPase (P-type)